MLNVCDKFDDTLKACILTGEKCDGGIDVGAMPCGGGCATFLNDEKAAITRDSFLKFNYDDNNVIARTKDNSLVIDIQDDGINIQATHTNTTERGLKVDTTKSLGLINNRYYFISSAGIAYYVKKDEVKVDEKGRFIGDPTPLFKELHINYVTYRNNYTDGVVCIGGKNVSLKSLVARNFNDGYRKGCAIRFIDGNTTNYNYRNLEVIARGPKKEVVVKKKAKKEESRGKIREAIKLTELLHAALLAMDNNLARGGNK